MPAIGRLESLPRTPLCHLPTPLEPMENLAREFDCEALYVKRDDCTGLAMGGNKVRQLEFYFGDALACNADTVLITGATQSNFVRLTAAGAARLGLECHIQLEKRVSRDDELYRTSGNVLLDRLLGAHLSDYPDGEDEAGADATLETLAERLREAGKHPYVIHLSPGHAPLGALGYVVAAQELLAQIAQRTLTIDEVFVGSGSGHTHAGLLFGLRALGSTLAVTGVCVRREREAQTHRIAARCDEIAELLSVRSPVGPADIVLDDSVLAPGYGRMNDRTRSALESAARCEGLLLDPVYTGKVMAGMLKRLSEGSLPRALFWHTGGTPALFAYEEDLLE